MYRYILDVKRSNLPSPACAGGYMYYGWFPDVKVVGIYLNGRRFLAHLTVRYQPGVSYLTAPGTVFLCFMTTYRSPTLVVCLSDVTHQSYLEACEAS